ncbi:c-type cytochrome [Flavobacterium antarcticum]|uniref:c-type cytochrome n=1 Tax=Flavobacterium antarcticum TaxID=271155 RepID=UPI0003B58E45|nr:c-type cytochrome [Flavobacterium antarcticum]
MNKSFLVVLALALVVACGKKEEKEPALSTPTTEEVSSEAPPYDPNRGEGKFDTVDLSPTLNSEMADKGKQIAEVKCSSCHKMTSEKLVGPGWKGVSERRKPEWIMNFITNPDPMIDKDPEVKAQLEVCLVRMPNQGISDVEAREILEYMRKIDGVK